MHACMCSKVRRKKTLEVSFVAKVFCIEYSLTCDETTCRLKLVWFKQLKHSHACVIHTIKHLPCSLKLDAKKALRFPLLEPWPHAMFIYSTYDSCF